MAQRWITVAMLAAATLVAFEARPNPAVAGPLATCEGQSAPDCGDAAGDALCVDAQNNPDPLQDCVDVDGCRCRPRVCCNCDTTSTNPMTISSCNLPCTETGIGLLVCVGLCAIVNDPPDDPCNLEIVNQATCSDGSCVTTGCCTFAETNERTVSGNVCVETNAETCGLLGSIAMFVPGGSCVGGLSGTCTAPTATATATATATVTVTATASSTATATQTRTITQTPTVTQTPTNTLVPNGGDCVTPSECASTFCVNGVCCNTACDQPLETCNNPADPGTCTGVTAPVPTLSTAGVLAGLLVLCAIGALALMYRRVPQ